MKTMLALILCAMVSGCGTLSTRGEFGFGAYPFQAVASDVVYISKTFEGNQENPFMLGMGVNGRWFLFWGLVSLPFDLAFDVVALPVDLVAWTFGRRKIAPANTTQQPTGAPSGAAAERQGR